MGYHIKRDGAFLCKADLHKYFDKSEKHNWYSFSDAHNLDLKGCCNKCKEKYFEIVSKLKEPIIV